MNLNNMDQKLPEPFKQNDAYFDQLKLDILQKTVQKPKSNSIRLFFKIAASVCIIFGVALFTTTLTNNKPSVNTISSAITDTLTEETLTSLALNETLIVSDYVEPVKNEDIKELKKIGTEILSIEKEVEMDLETENDIIFNEFEI